jgi:hypothetical protein
MEDMETLANTGNDTWAGVWSDRLLRVEWPRRCGLPSPYTLIPQDSPLLKLPAEGLAAHVIEALGMSEQGAQLFVATVREKQQECEMAVEEARLISPAKARNYLSQHSLRPDTLDVEALETPTDAATAALMAEREERMTRPALAGMRLLHLGLLPPGKHRLRLRHPPFAGKGTRPSLSINTPSLRSGIRR